MPEGQEKWFLDLAGLGTLADMVPLLGENRLLARLGLVVMRRGRRLGLFALLKLLRIAPETLTEDDIGFMVAPRINAASRMDKPETAARLLAATDPQEAQELARTLNKINDERKGVVASTVKEVNKRLLQNPIESPLIVMGSPNWRPGVLGLVANSLADTHGKTVCLWGREGGEVVRGSCRGGEIDIVELMRAAGDVFEDFGGHAGSGGFSIQEERVHELPSRLLAAYERLHSARLGTKEEVVIDRELDLAEVPHTLKDLSRLSPFGIGNEKPLFIFPAVTIGRVRQFGKASDHLEMGLSRGKTATTGMAFFSTPDSFIKRAEAGGKVDVIGHVERDWRGNPRVRVVEMM